MPHWAANTLYSFMFSYKLKSNNITVRKHVSASGNDSALSHLLLLLFFSPLLFHFHLSSLSHLSHVCSSWTLIFYLSLSCPHHPMLFCIIFPPYSFSECCLLHQSPFKYSFYSSSSFNSYSLCFSVFFCPSLSCSLTCD